jgi:hypothetical protein
MAGSIFGKDKGLNIRKRIYSRILLNCRGLRVDYYKTQGLKCKTVTFRYLGLKTH